MAEFVLVHGSFHGGWLWRDVASNLRADGHTVHTPTMTGGGNRHHLVGPSIGISVNIQDIINVLEYRDLRDVVLVGHSYGALVISGVAERSADRLKRLVYFDGFIPDDGQSAWDIYPEGKTDWAARTEGTGTDWLVRPPDPTEKYGESGPLAERQRDMMTPMAMRTHSEPIHLPENRAENLPRSYICCTQYDAFRAMAEKARIEGFDYREMKTHHNPIFYMPDVTAEVLRSTVDPL